MFGLFQKKEKKVQTSAPDLRGEEYKAFAADCLPEELDILAVTGANGFSGGRKEGEQLWTVGVVLTAWMEEDCPEICREETRLVTKADDTLMDYLRQHVPGDFIIQCKAHLSKDGKRLLLADLPKPGFDPELKAVLDEQKQPVTFEAEGLGTFTLNRRVGWFETEIRWMDTPVSLTVDQEEDRADSLLTARTLLEGQREWDGRVREFAADQLLSLANDWTDGGEEEEMNPVTREGFLERMELESIQVYENGRFEFWFADGDLFYGHSIHVSGSLNEGPAEAQMEG